MRTTPLHDWIAAKIGLAPSALTKEALRTYQLQKLREVLSYVQKHSPFYRAQLRDYVIKLSALEDLADLPFTTPEDIRIDPLRFLCGSQDEIERVVTLASSGTTGEPKRIYFSREDQEETMDFFRVGMSTLVEPGDLVLILFPGERPGSVGDLLKKALSRIGVLGVPHGLVQDVDHTLTTMIREGVHCLVGIPSQILALARRQKQRPDSFRLKSVLLSGDYVADSLLQSLMSVWSCKVFVHYGMTETGFGGGVQCEARCGLHLREADFLFEIVNPATGAPAAEGEEGEIVFTTLTTQGMPLVRYRTGDVGCFLPDPCACGTTLRSLDRFITRRSASVKLDNGRQLAMADLERALCSVEGLLGFSAFVDLDRSKDRLRIQAQALQGKEDQVVQSVRLALESVPAIREGRESGELGLAIQVGAANVLGLPGLAKRTITDERGFAGTSGIREESMRHIGEGGSDHV